ncbi:GNAT family N-acetyltransferase [Pontibacter beigongshangensis]|uniref:GNAT family N-acetyltransferase n=1 Tax=Pontibacter beigongshangensis TaxID=2574733 RepID=UPI00164F2F44|nr:GNAT family N-acetyltransferase [Pontibacter beigongshangensis]
MIRYLRHHQLDKTQWDACISASAERQVYALSWYLDVVSPGWCAVVEEEQGRYVAVLPLPVARKLGVQYLRQPLFCQQLGVFATAQYDYNKVGELLEVARSHFSLSTTYSFNTANTKALQQVPELQQELQTFFTHYLRLDKPYESLYRHYSRDRKLNLRRAQQANLQVVERDDPEPMITFFREHVQHKIYGGVAEEAYTLLRRLYRELQSRQMVKMWYTATADGELNAAAMFMFYGDRIIYLFNAANAAGRAGNGRTLLLNEVIKQNANSSRILDFESPQLENIAHFYASFGSTAVPFRMWQFNRLPLPLKLLRQLRMDIYRKFTDNSKQK